MKHLAILLLLAITSYARAGVVTLTAQGTTGTNGVAELSIGPYEVAEVVSFPTAGYSGFLYVIKDGITIRHPGPTGGSTPTKPYDAILVAGPARFRLESYNGPALCTLRITPEAFPPDRTILVPPGTNQVSITLEHSTNLVQWFSTTNGVYGPLPEAKFFRIKLEPLP